MKAENSICSAWVIIALRICVDVITISRYVILSTFFVIFLIIQQFARFLVIKLAITYGKISAQNNPENILKKIIIMALICSQLTACATMFGASNNKAVKVNANTENAKIYVDGKYYGVTSTGQTLIRLDGSEGHNITVEKNGYQSITIPVNRVVQGAYYFNIPLLLFFIIPGVIGFIVDGTTDNMYKYEPLYFNISNN